MRIPIFVLDSEENILAELGIESEDKKVTTTLSILDDQYVGHWAKDKKEIVVYFKRVSFVCPYSDALMETFEKLYKELN